MHPRWKRFAVALVCLGICTLVSACGGESPDDAAEVPAPDGAPGPGEVHIPLPPLPEGEKPHVKARGMYVLETAEVRVSLELMGDKTFRFLTTRGDERRVGSGTWSLTGSRLTLAYTEVDGASHHDKPIVAVNLWFGQTIELKDTGLPGRIVLTKRAMIKQR